MVDYDTLPDMAGADGFFAIHRPHTYQFILPYVSKAQLDMFCEHVLNTVLCDLDKVLANIRPTWMP